MDMDYYDTFIAVADDCPVTASVTPTAPGGKTTVAALQYDMLAGHPYELTQPDVLFESWRRRQDLDDASRDEIAELREEFFSKPRACLRSSPLPKKFGFGLSFDGDGRVALVPMESREYDEHQARPGVKVLKALRSSRA